MSVNLSEYVLHWHHKARPRSAHVETIAMLTPIVGLVFVWHWYIRNSKALERLRELQD